MSQAFIDKVEAIERPQKRKSSKTKLQETQLEDQGYLFVRD